MSVVEAKKADNRAKYIIFGYTREDSNKFDINIPMNVQYLFIAFYWIHERFALWGDRLKIDPSNSNLIKGTAEEQEKGNIYSVDNKYNTIYGSENTINGNDSSIYKYEWSLRYTNISSKLFVLGLDSSKGSMRNGDFTSANSSDYIGITPYGATFAKGSIQKKLAKRSKFNSRDEDAVIYISLHPRNKTIAISSDEQPMEYIFAENIDISKQSFQFAIAQPSAASDSIELIDFRVHQKL